MKGHSKGRAARARRNQPRSDDRRAPSAKAIEIVGLVEAISADMGPGNGVYLGRGIARLLADAYRERRGTVPAWVKELVVHYTETRRES